MLQGGEQARLGCLGSAGGSSTLRPEDSQEGCSPSSVPGSVAGGFHSGAFAGPRYPPLLLSLLQGDRYGGLLDPLREDTGQRRPEPRRPVVEAAGWQPPHCEPTSPLSRALVIFSEAVVTRDLAGRHPLSNARCSSQKVNPVFTFAFCLPGRC